MNHVPFVGLSAHLAWIYGIKNRQWLSDTLGIPFSLAGHIIQHLQTEGLLTKGRMKGKRSPFFYSTVKSNEGKEAREKILSSIRPEVEHVEKEVQEEEVEQDTVADSQPEQDSPQFLPPPPPPFKLDKTEQHAQEKATLGRSWSTATTVMMMENTPRSPPPLTRESHKRKEMSLDWDNGDDEDEVIPSSQVIYHDSMEGVARRLFESKTDEARQDDPAGAKKRKVSVVKRTIGVL